MTIWADIAGATTEAGTAPAAQGGAVVTVGVFDGVHRGHQELLTTARAEAERRGARLIAITFWPHPVAVLAPGHAPARLTSIERRVELLRRHGADEVRVLAFSREMSTWSPAEFVDRVILRECGAVHVVVGANFRFGAKAAGDSKFLIEYGKERGFSAVGHPLGGDEGDGEFRAFSSSRVRAALAVGDVAEAADVLARLHEVEGVIVHGDHRGKDLGFPTANLPVCDDVAAPADGVYAAWFVQGNGDRLPAAVSVGTNPTFDGVDGRRVESYVLDRDDLDLYGESVRVEFVARIRDMEAFASVDALVKRMRQDVDDARTHLT